MLDEVTTHLDADTIVALVRELNAYEGALLVVTHDRFFVRTVVEGEDPYGGDEGMGTTAGTGTRNTKARCGCWRRGE